MNNHYKSSSLDDAESLWVESEALKPVTELAKRSKPSAIITVFVLLVIMYPYVDRGLWLIWAVLHGLSLIVRTAYIAYLKNGQAEKSKNYHFNNLLIIALIAFIWGSTAYPLLAGERSKMEILALNLIFIYGIGGTINISLHLRSLLIFLTCYGAGLVGAVFATMIFSAQNNSALDSVVILIFMFLFLYMLHKFGTETNKSHIKSLRLQYNNKQLIESLMVEKQTAINAVDVKNRIMASATHDMRQPILALDLYTEMLISAPETSYKLVPKISEATKAVITMFDAMFDFSRMSMNQLSPVKVKFNIKDIIVALVSQYSVPAKDKGLQLRVLYKNSDREMVNDPILLRRILSNLISNAIKYTETGGILLVCRDGDKYGFRVEVWDTGVGISPAMQEAVFSEFYKNPENTGTSEGFGLGLAIVAQLCVLLGHKLTMKSRRGRGTMVSIRFSNSVVLPHDDL
jgi:signal transduction histidine kinase